MKQALVGEGPDEDQLFSPEGVIVEDGVNSQIENYLQKIKVSFVIVQMYFPEVH